ncbi:hypothetical protein QBC39DRAFT_369833 [Podospora conica]|nr:hypothetical protein QBC39DRAFT_369833 [Schizothecium conicum]
MKARIEELKKALDGQVKEEATMKEEGDVKEEAKMTPSPGNYQASETTNTLTRCIAVNRHDRYLYIEGPINAFRDDSAARSNPDLSVCYNWLFRL